MVDAEQAIHQCAQARGAERAGEQMQVRARRMFAQLGEGVGGEQDRGHLCQARARAQAGLWTSAPQPLPTYYDYVLGLFGTGWDEQRYQFLPSGKLKLRTEKVCLPNAKKP